MSVYERIQSRPLTLRPVYPYQFRGNIRFAEAYASWCAERANAVPLTGDPDSVREQKRFTNALAKSVTQSRYAYGARLSMAATAGFEGACARGFSAAPGGYIPAIEEEWKAQQAWVAESAMKYFSE